MKQKMKGLRRKNAAMETNAGTTKNINNSGIILV